MNIYRKALEIFREIGGCKGLLYEPDSAEDGTGQVCLIGAVALAKGYTLSDLDENNSEHDPEMFYNMPELEPLCAKAREMFPHNALLRHDSLGNIWAVNDQEGSEAVEALLEKVALEQEERV